MNTDLRYPIGKLELASPTDEVRRRAIDEIAALPALVRKAASGLSDQQLDTPYRFGGWTVRQVVHHLPDSHMHAYIRLKTALTENAPVIKPYDEARWAELPDSRLPIATSLAILEGVHERMSAIFRTIAPADWGRTFVHPEFPDGPRTLDWHLQNYAWHGRHHVAHITGLRTREGW